MEELPSEAGILLDLCSSLTYPAPLPRLSPHGRTSSLNHSTQDYLSSSLPQAEVSAQCAPGGVIYKIHKTIFKRKESMLDRWSVFAEKVQPVFFNIFFPKLFFW